MAGGWTRDGAVQDQIDDSVKDAVSLARALLPSGEGSDSRAYSGFGAAIKSAVQPPPSFNGL